MTRRGVEKDLTKKIYLFQLNDVKDFDIEINIPFPRLLLSFSSQINKEKFTQQAFIFYKKYEENFIRQTGCNTDVMIILALVKLYNKIEHRGFYAEVDGEVINGWPENIRIGHLTLNIKNYSKKTETIKED